MLSISGAPYDTLQTAIGISKEESKSSLKAFGVKYEQIELIDNDFDINSIKERVSKKDIKLIEIQRSKGYSTRKSLTIDKIEKAIKAIREVNKDVIIMVDNCYGEFVEEKEPNRCWSRYYSWFLEKFRCWYCDKWCIYCRKKRIK